MRRNHASVQALLPLEEIAGDVIRLRGGEFRGVLEAGSVNFALKSEAEQEAILAGYRRFLNGVAYPLQLLVRVVPADVEAYLAGLRSGRRGGDGPWLDLAADHEAFVRRIARERTLLDRRCYVIVPSGTRAATEAGGRGWTPWRRRSRHNTGSSLVAARRALAFRCAEVAQGLAAFGVVTRRLEGPELMALWRASLHGTPLSSAASPPVPTPVLAAPSHRREVSRA